MTANPIVMAAETQDMHLPEVMVNDNSSMAEVIPTLDELNNAEVVRLVPTIVYLMIISLCGILGNSLVCHVYRTRYRLSNSQCFILCLSAIDLFSCCIVIPFEVATIVEQYTFTDLWLCKLSRFFNTLGTLSSSFLLLVIAIDRFRKVCKPFGWQISSNLAKALCGVSIALGLLFSCPAVFIYGKKTVQISQYNVTGTECSTADEMSDSAFPFVNAAVFGTLFLTGIVSISILYCFIGREVHRHVQKMPSDLMRNPSVPMLSSTIDPRDSRISANLDINALKTAQNTKGKPEKQTKTRKRRTIRSESDISWGERKDFELSYTHDCRSKNSENGDVYKSEDQRSDIGEKSDSEDSGIKTKGEIDSPNIDGDVNDYATDKIPNSERENVQNVTSANLAEEETLESEHSDRKSEEVKDVDSNDNNDTGDITSSKSMSESKEKIFKYEKSASSKSATISSRISHTVTRLTSVVSRRSESSASGLAKTQYLRQARARKTAFLMFLISMAFVISYMPHLLLMLIRQLQKNFVENMSDKERAIYRFFLRSYFLNCAINPVIYGVCDTRFRTACKELFSKCCRRCW